MSKALEAAVKAASAAILAEGGNALRVEPIPRSMAPVGANLEWIVCDGENFCIEPHTVARAAIAAFLDAAAEDFDLCRRVGEAAADKAEIAPGAAGTDAILALKEAVNG